MHPEILSTEQKEIFKELTFLSDQGFYLAGGTALALQLGHRTSVDFDFYIPKHFDSAKLATEFTQRFGEEIKINQQTEDTLKITIRNTWASFFYYPYELIRLLRDFEGIKLSSVEDIAAMKAIAVVQRGRKRDFFDIYYLVKGIGFERLIFHTLEKYPNYEVPLILKALSYFDDADKEIENGRIDIFDKNLTWEEVKKTIFEKVRAYQLQMFE